MKDCKYALTLTDDDRKKLDATVKKGVGSARAVRRALVLLNFDKGSNSTSGIRDLSEKLMLSRSSIYAILKDYRTRGIGCIHRIDRKKPPMPRKITGETEVHLIALACSEPPKGYARWTLRLLSNRMVQLQLIDSISHTTAGKILRGNRLKPHLVREWCITSKYDAALVARMEMVLDVYKLRYDRRFPVICMDEKPLQLLRDLRRGRRRKDASYMQDSEYIRKGTCSIFMFTEPLTGFRYAKASNRRTKVDWARHVKYVVDHFYPDAEKITLVCDNLNTHDKSSFYEAFPCEEANRLSHLIEIVYTPKHASWLNIAEIELSSLSRQCLDKRRIESLEELNDEMENWWQDRNAMQKGVDWQFTTDDARIKLKHLYPKPVQ